MTFSNVHQSNLTDNDYSTNDVNQAFSNFNYNDAMMLILLTVIPTFPR